MVLHSRGCGRVARRRFKRIGPPGRAFGSREAPFSFPGFPSGSRSGNPHFLSLNTSRAQAFYRNGFIDWALCITSYPNVAPSRTRLCITTRQRLSRPPTRVGANAALSFGYTVAVSAVLGISRIAIHNPATCMFRLTSSSSHIPARRATSPAEGNSRAIAGHNRTIPRIRQHIKPRPGGFIAIHRALLYQPQRYLYTVYRSKRKPCRFACTATALAFTPSSIAFAAIWSLNASTGRSVSRKS